MPPLRFAVVLVGTFVVLSGPLVVDGPGGSRWPLVVALVAWAALVFGAATVRPRPGWYVYEVFGRRRAVPHR